MNNTMTVEGTASSIDHLLEVLHDELAVYKQLLAVIQNKRQAIISGEVDTLRDIVRQEHTSIRTALDWVETRTSLTNRILNQYGVKDSSAPLRKIISVVNDAEIEQQLFDLRGRLKECYDQICETNSENRYLLNSSITFVQELMHVLLSPDDASGKMYGVNGMLHRGKAGQKVLDYQI